MKGHNPNDGAGKMHHSGNAEGGRKMGGLSAGVKDGLSSNKDINVKNAEMVSQNQRPKGRTENIGNGMKIGC